MQIAKINRGWSDHRDTNNTCGPTCEENPVFAYSFSSSSMANFFSDNLHKLFSLTFCIPGQFFKNLFWLPVSCYTM